MSDEELYIVEAMERYGGSFVKQLAKCFYAADIHNILRLKIAFPEYWEEYSEFARKDKEKNEKE